MPTIDTMSLEDIDATMAQLHARRKALKSSSTVAQRKIVTLARRRERLMQQVHVIDAQIEQLHRDTTAPVASAPRRRGRPPKTAKT